MVSQTVTVRGPKGQILMPVSAVISLTRQHDAVILKRDGDSGEVRALHGALRAQLANAVIGVTNGWTKTLELSGVGYRASISGANLVLTVGFSHPVTIVPPQGISFTITEGKITVSGIDRHLVGQVAATIHAVKPPEPYKGKGIKYMGEVIRKKAGKAKAVGGAPGAK